MEKTALIWNIVVSVLAVIGTAVCAIQFAMAIRFLEIGRVIFYFFLASLCIETSVFSIANLIKKRK